MMLQDADVSMIRPDLIRSLLDTAEKFQLHNVILSSGSLLLLVLMLEEILPIMWNHGLHYALCSEQAWTPVRLTLTRHCILAQSAGRGWSFII